MPPKRKAAAAKAAKPPKMQKTDSTAVMEKAVAAMKKEAKADSKKQKSYAADDYCGVYGAVVHEDRSFMLNQTNIGHNNNKYYVGQILTAGPVGTKQADDAIFYVFFRWGRVGEPGSNSKKGPMGLDEAVSMFEKKFKEKTVNAWNRRDNFVSHKGKYTMLEIADADEDDNVQVSTTSIDNSVNVKVKCSLDNNTQALISMIFDDDMMAGQMSNFQLDMQRMPLGKLSKTQIAAGFECLLKLNAAINSGKGNLQQLSSDFYTNIPHSFGRSVPPTMKTKAIVQAKMDMLAVLGDIEIAQSMKKAMKSGSEHPLVTKYKELDCDLESLRQKSEEFKIIEAYCKATGCSTAKKLLNVWRVNRHSEGKRFAKHDKLDNRKLLWHGTSVAVVAAILKTGLRIMPHSGGRVGKGIYFASEQSKSAGYVGSHNKKAIMFLNEVALGKEHHIKSDDHTLKAAPPGYDSVLARGRVEPDPKITKTLKLDGKPVVVPQGKPKPFESSTSFSQSEYLVYEESQARIRYMLQFEWAY